MWSPDVRIGASNSIATLSSLLMQFDSCVVWASSGYDPNLKIECSESSSGCPIQKSGIDLARPEKGGRSLTRGHPSREL